VYRLLRTILNTAVDDEILPRNPAKIKNAGVEHSAERPTATVPQVYAVANAIEPMFRAMVLLATFASLRLGELRGLRRRHLDLLHGTVKVEKQVQQDKHGNVWFGAPKTDAGVRTVAIPAEIIPDLERHLAEFAAQGRDGLIFPGVGGKPFRLATFYTAWTNATKTTGLAEMGLRLHDLRHTGNTLAAVSGATTKELMARAGHSTADAALRYQHATKERDKTIAELMGQTIRKARSEDAAPVIPLRAESV
jgi:integrase